MLDVAAAKAIAAQLISGLEACKLTAYPDPGSQDGAPWTIGYGSTTGVRKGLKITKAQALSRLTADLDVAVGRLRNKIGAVMDELTEHQAAAMFSFVFNLGTPGNTIWKRLRARQFDQVPLEMIKFVNNDGKKMQGLVNRRTAEIRCWSTNEPGSVPDNPPSAVTRSTPTPPAPADPTPPQKSAQIMTLVGSATTATTVAAASITQAVSPYADHSEIIQRVVSMLAIVAAIAAVVGLTLAWLKKHEARG